MWRSECKFGKPIVDKVTALVESKPVGMTEVYISPSMYKFKFGTKLKRGQ